MPRTPARDPKLGPHVGYVEADGLPLLCDRDDVVVGRYDPGGDSSSPSCRFMAMMPPLRLRT